MTLAIARLNVSGENGLEWLNDAGDPHHEVRLTPWFEALSGGLRAMTEGTKELTPLIVGVSWPLVSLIIVFSFYPMISNILKRLAESLTVKNIKLKIFGVELEVTPQEAEKMIDDILTSMFEETTGLSKEDEELFEKIIIYDGKITVKELIPNFARDTEEHNMLRRLRGHKLIRPLEGSNWQYDKHPVVTEFGKLLHKLRVERLSRAKP